MIPLILAFVVFLALAVFGTWLLWISARGGDSFIDFAAAIFGFVFVAVGIPGCFAVVEELIKLL